MGDPVETSVDSTPEIFISPAPDLDPTTPVLNVITDMPNIIVVEQLSEQGRANLAANPRLALQLANSATSGSIHEKGEWVQNPGSPWPIEKIGVGQYKVNHNWGYYNLSLSVALSMSRGTARIIENNPNYFIVHTYIDKVLTDAPFVFSLNRIISPPPQP